MEAVVGLLVRTAISYVVNAVTNKLFGTKKAKSVSPTYSLGPLQTQTNSSMIMPIIYGKVKCAGNNLWQGGSGQSVPRLVGFGVGKNQSVSDVRLDDKPIAECPGCSYTAYMGDGEQEIDSRVTGATQTEKAKLLGGLKYDAYLALTIAGSDKITSNPNVTAIWEGRIIREYTTPTTYTEAYSNNPAWCIFDFMTSVDGCGIPHDDMDIQSFITAAAYFQPGDDNRHWELNLILDEKKSRQDWLNEMLLTCRSWRTYQRGKHGILVDKPEPVSQIFTVKKTEAIQHNWQELKDDVERVIIKYIDPEYEWQNVGAPATIVPPFRNRKPLEKIIEVHGITNFKQASQQAWFALKQAQTCQDTIIYTCNKRALNRTIGDVIGVKDSILQITEPGLDYKRYRIMAMTEPQGTKIQMVAKEYNEALYTDQLGSVAPVVNVVTLPNPTVVPPAVENLVLSEYGWMTPDGIHISNIDVAFDPVNYSDTVSYIISISQDQVEWQYVNTIPATTFRIPNVSLGTKFVGVQAVNKAGLAGERTVKQITITGKDDKPPDVETLLVEKLASGAYRLTFKMPSQPIDLAGYRLKYNIGSSIWWENAIQLFDGKIVASPLETNVIPKGTVTVMVKAVDNAGNESENVAYAIIGVGDEIVDNVLYQTDFSGFPGDKTNCHLDSGIIVADSSDDLMYPVDNNAAIYPQFDSELFYRVNWPAMSYEDTFFPEYNGLLSFAADVDGNAQIFYRKQFPYAMYGADYDLFYPDDSALMYREGPWVPYAGKVETVKDIHQVRVDIADGRIQGRIRSLKAIVDVPDTSETINDLVIPDTGIRVPITKNYVSIKNVNITIQDNGTGVQTVRVMDKDPTLGPFLTCYDKNDVAVSGLLDITVQGIPRY